MKSLHTKSLLSCVIVFAILQGCGGGGGGGGSDSGNNVPTNRSATSTPSATDTPTTPIAQAQEAIRYFKASNTDSGDTFGWAIAISDDGNTIAVGAPSEDSNATGIDGDRSNNASVDSGAVYVFTHSQSGWIQQAYVKATSVQSGAYFGASVALSSDGNTLAVGAPLANGGAGVAYVLKRNGATWSYQNPISASNAYADSNFGWSIALSDSGNTLAVGAPGESNSVKNVNADTRAASAAGAVYIFTPISAGAWGNQIYLKASSVAANDNFGAALGLSGSGNLLAVGAPNKSNGTGAVYTFAYNGSAWSTPLAVTASNAATGDNFGAAVALNTAGDTLAVGAPYKANNGANAGEVYAFIGANSGWAEQTHIVASNTAANDDFGTALALSSDGNTLVVGAIGESSNATGLDGSQSDNSKDGVGAAYLFNRSGSSWTQQRYIKPSTSTVGDEFGTAIGLSADGSTLAISGAFEQSNATGIGGSQTNTSATDAGALWLFE